MLEVVEELEMHQVELADLAVAEQEEIILEAQEQQEQQILVEVEVEILQVELVEVLVDLE